MRLSDAQMLAAFDELGISASELHNIRTPGSLSDMQGRLEDLQIRVKRGFKAAALRLHPDVNSDEGAESLFKLVSEVVRQIMALRVKERPKTTPLDAHSKTYKTGYGSIRINIKVKD